MVHSFKLVLHVTTACIWIWIWLNTEQAAATDVTLGSIQPQQLGQDMHAQQYTEVGRYTTK